jgi:hypothetical protein
MYIYTFVHVNKYACIRKFHPSTRHPNKEFPSSKLDTFLTTVALPFLPAQVRIPRRNVAAVAEKFGRARKAGACGLAAFQPTVDKMYEHVRGRAGRRERGGEDEKRGGTGNTARRAEMIWSARKQARITAFRTSHGRELYVDIRNTAF